MPSALAQKALLYLVFLACIQVITWSATHLTLCAYMLFLWLPGRAGPGANCQKTNKIK